MRRLAAFIAYAIQPHLGVLADHAAAVAWVLMIVGPAILCLLFSWIFV